jgi:hypothetical protein
MTFHILRKRTGEYDIPYFAKEDGPRLPNPFPAKGGVATSLSVWGPAATAARVARPFVVDKEPGRAVGRRGWGVRTFWVMLFSSPKIVRRLLPLSLRAFFEQRTWWKGSVSLGPTNTTVKTTAPKPSADNRASVRFSLSIPFPSILRFQLINYGTIWKTVHDSPTSPALNILLPKYNRNQPKCQKSPFCRLDVCAVTVAS